MIFSHACSLRSLSMRHRTIHNQVQHVEIFTRISKFLIYLFLTFLPLNHKISRLLSIIFHSAALKLCRSISSPMWSISFVDGFSPFSWCLCCHFGWFFLAAISASNPDSSNWAVYHLICTRRYVEVFLCLIFYFLRLIDIFVIFVILLIFCTFSLWLFIVDFWPHTENWVCFRDDNNGWSTSTSSSEGYPGEERKWGVHFQHASSHCRLGWRLLSVYCHLWRVWDPEIRGCHFTYTRPSHRKSVNFWSFEL